LPETHFIADLHLVDGQESKARWLADYLAGPARTADALYVMGDLFDVWIGDDGSIPQHAATLDGFAELVDAGVPVYFIRGNRDFAVGSEFENRSGMRIIEDPTVVTLYGVPTLLAHGDLFCTDDVSHQAFRRKYLDANWRRRRLALPLWLRRTIAQWARRRSTRAKSQKSEHIMDVNAETVAQIAAQYGARRIIHGHTHRPADHTSPGLSRHVLADWRDATAEVLIVSEGGIARWPID
jgi:UDP-2,3-diacylglucosamine hydrolase